ncbi:hypothetical protein FGG78_39940, partial [Thioclava sp. BHET1]
MYDSVLCVFSGFKWCCVMSLPFVDLLQERPEPSYMLPPPLTAERYPPPVPYSKRLLDIMLALLALIFFSPAFLAVALLLKFREKGPVFYGHERIGRDGRKFRCLKFRTMAVDGDRILAELLERDPE